MKNLAYDAVVVFDISKDSISYANSVLDTETSLSQYILNVLQYGLSSRVRGICELENAKVSKKLAFGLFFEPDQIFRLVDKGPSPSDNPNAAESFRKFWGPSKSQLRKFQNTNIIECVVWDAPEIKTDRSKILKAMVQHMMEVHLKLDPGKIQICGLELLPLSDVLSQPLDKADGSSLLNGSFSKLKTSIMGLESSLAIQSILPISSSMRGSIYTDFPHLPSPSAYLSLCKENINVKQAFIPVHTVLLILETSNRWPTEPKAFHAMATAFLGNLGAGIQRTTPDLVPSISTNGAGPSFMDVFCSGFVFRCYLDLGFAFHQPATWLSLENKSIRLLPKEETLQKDVIHLSLWRELSDHFPFKTNANWMSKCNEFSFLIFTEALAHDSFVKNSIYAMHPKPILDGIKLLLLWISNKRLSDFFPFEAVEKIVIESNMVPARNEDDSAQSAKETHQISIFDPSSKNKTTSQSMGTFPTSPTSAFINSIHFLGQQENAPILEKIGVSISDFSIISQLALKSLSVASLLFTSPPKRPLPSESLLLEMFKVNDFFDFSISFESGKFLSDIRESIVCDIEGIKQTQEDILSSLMLPGFNPLSIVSNLIKVSSFKFTVP
ncbi:hypothetical protein DI09_72p90 [Mitosporidium daphniae]|uniref:U3 small nucleolar RNA-associated protein 22 n=1 Tax=Mitosporidium daphniae TaxID=1485682 RepID=A0A098VN91_9MICR|nr:uncharacterized protein DI09_72p90 [Mitosporidium daphniae]KGG50390.1 hypothetical protein DI09_72p90 [Mitosporidium daphniae]|eukprot:XP_013236833.1 uncharacterized protein DI09_72p90 [Mitosporidium daphniae]